MHPERASFKISSDWSATEWDTTDVGWPATVSVGPALREGSADPLCPHACVTHRGQAGGEAEGEVGAAYQSVELPLLPLLCLGLADGMPGGDLARHTVACGWQGSGVEFRSPS